MEWWLLVASGFFSGLCRSLSSLQGNRQYDWLDNIYSSSVCWQSPTNVNNFYNKKKLNEKHTSCQVNLSLVRH